MLAKRFPSVASNTFFSKAFDALVVVRTHRLPKTKDLFVLESFFGGTEHLKSLNALKISANTQNFIVKEKKTTI